MDDDLEARLQSHAQAFDGLLSLIPAKEYFAKDNSNQWQAKKQTKEQKRLARKAKLDPANQKTAKDVQDENERKRKRELDGHSEDETLDQQQVQQQLSKRQKVDGQSGDAAGESSLTEEERKQAKAEKRRLKREKKHEKAERKRDKIEAKKAKKDEQDLDEALRDRQQQDKHSERQTEDIDNDATGDADDLEDDVDERIDIDGLVDGNDEANLSEAQSSTPTSQIDSPIFDIASERLSADSASSSSSIDPPPKSSSTAKHPTIPSSAPQSQSQSQPKQSQEDLQARLRARIDLLRAKRKADGPDGQGAKSRQDLLDARRKKSDARKQHKKELRQRAKAEEERLNNERLRGSGSPLTTTDLFSPILSPAASESHQQPNFQFGRIALEDGTDNNKLSGSGSGGGGGSAGTLVFDPASGSAISVPAGGAGNNSRRRVDAKHALEAAEKKKSRLAGMDASTRADIESKDAWLNAKKRAHGERVRDDASLLKKTLKRKETAKLKSEKAWNERNEGVKKGKEARQRKREENLANRKDGGDKAKKGGKAKGGAAKKSKGRPGFEGSLRSR